MARCHSAMESFLHTLRYLPIATSDVNRLDEAADQWLSGAEELSTNESWRGLLPPDWSQKHNINLLLRDLATRLSTTPRLSEAQQRRANRFANLITPIAVSSRCIHTYDFVSVRMEEYVNAISISGTPRGVFLDIAPFEGLAICNLIAAGAATPGQNILFTQVPQWAHSAVMLQHNLRRLGALDKVIYSRNWSAAIELESLPVRPNAVFVHSGPSFDSALTGIRQVSRILPAGGLLVLDRHRTNGFFSGLFSEAQAALEGAVMAFLKTAGGSYHMVNDGLITALVKL